MFRSLPSKRLILSLLLLFFCILIFIFRNHIKTALIRLNSSSDVVQSPDNRKHASRPGSVWGIDLSHHQPHIDWDRMARLQKPHFIFLKATEGTSHTDTRYRSYISKARDLHIPVGAYHFFSYNTPGANQARHFIRQSRLQKGDLLPVLDVEYRPKMKGKKWIISEIDAFCREIKAEYGVYPIIYCECAFFQQYLQHHFADLHYWISDLHRQPRCNYLIWQYTDKGFVEGIGYVDKNRLRKGENILNYCL